MRGSLKVSVSFMVGEMNMISGGGSKAAVGEEEGVSYERLLGYGRYNFSIPFPPFVLPHSLLGSIANVHIQANDC